MGQSPKLICIGHRGAAGHKPENTLASFQHACELGADFIELDVWFSGGQVICIHDETLERTTSGRGPHRSLPHNALQTLDAGQGERVPKFSEVIEAVHGRCKIMVEFKDAAALEPCVALLKTLQRQGKISPQDFILQSFDLEIVRRAAELARDFPRACLFKRPALQDIDVARQLAACALHLNFERLTPALLQSANLAGLAVYVYTVNNPVEIRRMIQLGVSGITSDFPDRVIAAREQLCTGAG